MAISFTSSFSSIAGTFLGDFQTEDSARPHELSEYYRGGDFVPDSAQYSDIPTSGTISVSDFGFATSTLTFQVTVDSNVNNLFLDSYATANGWNGNDILEVTINPDVIVGAPTPDRNSPGPSFIGESAGDLRLLNGLPALTINTNNTIINNYGIIYGHGGAGGGFVKHTEAASTFTFLSTGGVGGSAIEVTGNNVEIRNYDRILGGGGGGGYGREPGASPTIPFAGAGGGAGAGRPGGGSTNLNQTGGVQYDAYSSTPARGGGDGASWGVTTARIYSGEYGGLDFTSTGFNDGTDGSNTYYGGGGGGWGRPGRSGNDRGFPSAAGRGGYSVDATGSNVELQNFPQLGAIKAGDLEGNVDSETGVITTINITLDDLGTYGRLDTDLYEKANDVTGQGNLSDRSVPILTPLIFTISSDFDQTQTAYNKFNVISEELQTGGNFLNLTIINNGVIAGKGASASTGSNYFREAKAGINVTHAMGSLTVINNNFIASGGSHGASVTASMFANQNDNMSGTIRAGGGGGQGGGDGISSSYTASFPSTSKSASSGSYNLAGGSSSPGGSSSGSLGTHDRISVGTASGGAGSAGGGNGGAAAGAIQDNQSSENGREWNIRGPSGGGSSLTSVSGSSGSVSGTTTSSSGKSWAGDHATAVGQGGGAWATGTKSSIHGTSNASSYTLTNNGTIK